MPLGSVPPLRVTWMARSMATTLKRRRGAPDGQMPSGRLAQGLTAPAGAAAFSPSQGAPEWPLGENGGRLPTWGRSSG